MNPFELGEEMEYDEGTGREETALHLTEKIAILKGLLMAMIKFGKKEPDFADETAMDSILEEVLAHLFEIRGIVDGDPASLYVTQSDYSSEKKELPTIHEFYVEKAPGQYRASSRQSLFPYRRRYEELCA